MNGTTVIPIAPEDRTMAALTHLSGLAGYIIPFGGVLVPIIIWMMKKDVPLISAIARQAVIILAGVVEHWSAAPLDYVTASGFQTES